MFLMREFFSSGVPRRRAPPASTGRGAELLRVRCQHIGIVVVAGCLFFSSIFLSPSDRLVVSLAHFPTRRYSVVVSPDPSGAALRRARGQCGWISC